MDNCEVCRLLGAQYRRSRENAREAKQQFDRATNPAQAECASAWLRRAEEQWVVAISEMLTSPRCASCERPELGEVFADYQNIDRVGADAQPISFYIQ
jgi:hypothetical protein